jgi:23S rRNA (cytidine2498-2'-O)-methyltransferase
MAYPTSAPGETATTTSMSGLLAYCRPGFEGECAQELTAFGLEHRIDGFARTGRGSGFAEFVASDAATMADMPPHAWRTLIFSRQLLHMLGRAEAMSRTDRLAALLPIVEKTNLRWRDAWVEAPESDAGRELAALCRALNAALIAAMKRARLLDAKSSMRLHVLLTAADAAIVAAADVNASAPWPGGIPRLKFPRDAPSRSTLKLEEAFLVLLDEDERARWLKPGMSAVDLGAAPGGWTWQLVKRSIRTIAIDNGPMDPALIESGLVEHRRVDGFRFRPQRNVDWLVCDMVEQPRRVAELVAQWLAQRWCRRAIFNLKLPMKKRYDEVQSCLSIVRDALAGESMRFDLRAKQLYHDREEITVFAATG